MWFSELNILNISDTGILTLPIRREMIMEIINPKKSNNIITVFLIVFENEFSYFVNDFVLRLNE